MQPQEEVALRIEAIQFARARWPLFVAKAAAGTGAVGRFLPCSLLVQRLPSSRRRIAAASPVSSNAAAMRQSKLVGAAGIGPGGLFGGNGGSKTPIPVRLGGGPPVKFMFVFGKLAGHGRKCYSVAERLSRTGGRQLRRRPRPEPRGARRHAPAQTSSREWPARRVHRAPTRCPERYGFARRARRRQPKLAA